MPNSAHSINLVQSDNKNPFDTFIEWALTIGRFLVILTETIALITFVSRFSLDRQLVNLHDEIKRDQQYIVAFSSQETEFRTLQSKLAAIKKLDGASKDKYGITRDLLGILKDVPTINLLTINDTSFKIDCSLKSIIGVTAVVNAVKNYPRVGSVSIDKIENRSSTAIINLTLTANLKNAKK
jgi:hypothetical protein